MYNTQQDTQKKKKKRIRAKQIKHHNPHPTQNKKSNQHIQQVRGRR